MKAKLSERQERILAFIQQFMDENHYPPTVRDIQYGCEVSSTSVVDYNLHKLQAMGYLRRQPEVSRGIQLIGAGLPDSDSNIVTIPIMGSIAAGEPLYTPDAPSYASESHDTVDLPPFLTGDRQNVFALRVKGTSMIDALVADGDLVLLPPPTQATARWWRHGSTPARRRRSSASTWKATWCGCSPKTRRWSRSWCRPRTCRCAARW